MPQNGKLCKQIFSIACLLTILLFGSPTQASLITGSDWNGMDFIPGNGDILSGVFTNVNAFQINAGDIVSFGTQLEVFANAITIYGALNSYATSSSTLTLNALNINLASSGSINMSGYGNSLSLNAGTLILNGSINTDDQSQLAPVPLPSSIILFGSSLIVGFGLLRKLA
jgi:hypothetical protein